MRGSERKIKKSGNLKEVVYLPYNVLGINKQIDILRSLVDKYYKEHKAISYKDIGGIHASKTNVSGSLSFYANIGWLIKSENEYTPSENLIHYFKGLDKEKSRNELSQSLLQNYSIAKEIIFFIKEKSKSDRESIIKYLGTKFEFFEKDRKSINKLLDLLTAFDILKADDDGNLFQEEVEKDTTLISTLQEGQKEKVEFTILPTLVTQEKVNVWIGIMLTPEMSEDQMRKSIRMVLEEIGKLKG
jgi:hypothetical protein